MKFDNWIFVTGAPRSGTSFVGRILSWPLSVDLIFEPTDPSVGLEGINHRYIYLRPQTNDDNEYARLLAPIFTYQFCYRPPAPDPGDRWFTSIRKHVIGSRGTFNLWFVKLNPFHGCAVIKDPDGCLLTEYLHMRYRVKPVVCVRHPTAFVASYLHHQFPWDLPELARQRELLADYFDGDRQLFDVDRNDPVAGAAILWSALNRVLLDQCSRHPDWIVVVHEELCAAPVATFSSLFRQLGLPWSHRVERAIWRRTSRQNNAEARTVHDHHRNSAALFELRRGMLSREDRRKVFDITFDVASRVYSEQSFGLGDAEVESVASPEDIMVAGGHRRLRHGSASGYGPSLGRTE